MMTFNGISTLKIVSIRQLDSEELKLFHRGQEVGVGMNNFEIEVEADCDEDTAKRAIESLLKSFDEEGEVLASSVKQ